MGIARYIFSRSGDLDRALLRKQHHNPRCKGLLLGLLADFQTIGKHSTSFHNDNAEEVGRL